MAIHDASPRPPSSSALPSSSHRLPTVSATQALEDLVNNAPTPLSTGLSQLDALLSEHMPNGSTEGFNPAPKAPGLPPGSLIEVWGPSGGGKTTLTMTLAASALKSGAAVIWLDLSTPIVPHRLRSILGSVATEVDASSFHHLALPSLSHLLALLQNPPTYLPWTAQSLLVVENLHHAVDIAYPRVSHTGQGEQAKWASTRRSAVLGNVAALLRRLAAVHAIATAVVTTNASTRSRGSMGTGAVLVPALGGLEWERALGGRWVLFRDFASEVEDGKATKNLDWERPRRFVGVTKLGTRAMTEDDGDVGVVFQFDIDETGIVDLAQTRPRRSIAEGDVGAEVVENGTNGSSGLPTRMISPSHHRPSKRHFDEIADSESDGEYGWDEGDGDEVLVAAEGLIDEEDLFATTAPDAVPSAAGKVPDTGTEEGDNGSNAAEAAIMELEDRRHTG